MKGAKHHGIGVAIQQMVAGRYPGLTSMLTSMLLMGLLDYTGYHSEWEFLAKHGVPQQVIREVWTNVFRAEMSRPDNLAKLSAETRQTADRFLARDPETLSEGEYPAGLETVQALLVRDLRPA